MTIEDILADVRYVIDEKGEKTEVLIPLPAWKALLTSWQYLAEMLEDQENKAILEEWFEKRARGHTTTTSLEEFEREMIDDGLLPG